MDLTDNLSDAFNYSLKLTRNIGNLILLIVLSAIPIVNLIVIGYGARIFKEGPEEPPKMGRYGEAFIDGLKIVVIGLIYLLVPIILFSVTLGSMMTTVAIRGAMGATPYMVWPIMMPIIPVIGFILVVGILLVISFLFAIMGSMGVMHMLATGRFRKAFAFSEILKLIGRVGWAKYILWVLVMFILGIIVSSLSNIPWVGWIISSIITPFCVTFWARSARNVYPWAQETGA